MEDGMEDQRKKTSSWLMSEVQTLVAEDCIQKELDDATRKEKATSLLQAIENDSVRASDECSVAVLSENPPTPLASEPAPTFTAEAMSARTLRPHSGKRKRSLSLDYTAVVREILASDVEQQEKNRAQRERHFQVMMEDSREARQQELAMRREEATQAASFNQALLGVLGQIVQIIVAQNAAHQPQ